MWWLTRNGAVEGPFTSEQLMKRIQLNMLRSLDRVSEDKTRWLYVKDTVLWNPRRTIKDPEPPPQLRALSTPRRQSSADFSTEDLGEERGIPYRTSPAAISERLRFASVQPKKSDSRLGLWIGIGSVVLVLVVLAIAAAFVVQGKRSVVPDPVTDDASASSPPKPTPVGFNAVRDKLVIIECKESCGSGFLLEMDGKTYLVSNEHVLRSTTTPQAKLLDGTPLSLGAFSVATDRDLARYEVLQCDIVPFKISEAMPNTGDFVALYGNSLGGGVATESKGFVQGVGPVRLETNCEIVQGNSGSPLVDAAGNVVGVAAFMRNNGSGEQDWTIKNTRFDGIPRRFAIRFTNVSWKEIDRKSYEEQTASLEEFETYWEYLWPYLVFDTRDVDPSRLIFNDLKGKTFRSNKQGFIEDLRDLTKAYKRRSKTDDAWTMQCKGRKAYIQRLVENELSEEDIKRSVAEYDKKTTECYDKAKEAFRNMILRRKEALLHAKTFLSSETWDSPQMRNGYSSDDISGSVIWYSRGIEYFTDLMNQKLKDLNKFFDQLEKGDDEDDDEE